ncbi:MAG TPA: YibE/F family protein [Egibacteraceae bacterium]|nr:YibE/F family protein [Egibacteraceae bacterium]
MERINHATLLAVVGAVGLVAVVAMIAMWPGPRPLPEASEAQTTELLDATLLEVTPIEEADTTGLPPGAVLVEVTARVEATGETVRFETTDDTGNLYESGQAVRLAQITQPDLPPTYFISDFRRSGPMIVLTALFIVAVLSFGRLQGARALVGLALTFLLIVGFMIPAVLEGRSPLTVAVVGALLIMIVTLYLSHGFNAKTTAAVVGTSLALIVTGVLAVVFVEAANFTGFASEEARLANVEVGGLSLRGLLLAGIIIGGLGVLDDVTMSQSSTVFQLHRANPAAGFGQLLRGALAVGRDHIAATVNTLFLAYAGASLPLLILFAGSPDGLGTVVTSETVAVEVVRTLVGSVGLIAAVPITTALAAALVLGEPVRSTRARQKSDHELQNDARSLNTEDVVYSARPDDEEWEQRLRDAYRLPRNEEER